MSALIEVEVAQVRQLTPLVREFTLVPRAGRLPRFSAGSHIQLQLPVGERLLRNCYSLTGDPARSDSYRIAVRLQEASRGGSRHLHESIGVGQRLRITPPANLFALHSRARLHILIAGGIGITPFMAYVDELEQRGAAFELHYAFRTGLSDAYADALRQRLGARFHAYDGGTGPALDLQAVLKGRPVGTHVYTCGPQGLIADVRAQAQALGWADSCVHSEAFAAPEPGVAFSVELVRSQKRIEVAPGQSLLEALEDAGLDIPNMCRGGVCGQCATRHVGGEVEHRDSVLTAQERAHLLMPCVSRSCGTPVLLDL